MNCLNNRSKTLRTFTCLIAAFGIFTSSAAPKVIEVSCTDQLKKLITKERKSINEAISSGGTWHMKYIVTSELLNPLTKKYELHDTHVETLASEHYRYKKKNNTEAYSDDHDIFSINNSTNTISRILSRPQDLKIRDSKYSEILQDSFFKVMQITDCNQTKEGNKNIILYNFKARVNNSPYNKASVYIDSMTGKIYKMHIEMNLAHENQLKQLTILISDNEIIKGKEDYPPLKNKFLTNDGKLKSPYEKYHFKDMTRD